MATLLSPKLSLALLLAIVLFFSLSIPAQAAVTGGSSGTIPVAPTGTCDSTFSIATKPQCLQSLGYVYRNILNVIMGIAGFASFIMLVFGGFKFLTSQGDPKALGSARTTITWALIGLAMIIVSYLIIVLISNYTGIGSLQQFNIPSPP